MPPKHADQQYNFKRHITDAAVLDKLVLARLLRVCELVADAKKRGESDPIKALLDTYAITAVDAEAYRIWKRGGTHAGYEANSFLKKHHRDFTAMWDSKERSKPEKEPTPKVPNPAEMYF
jgi:hypothetical protein